MTQAADWSRCAPFLQAAVERAGGTHALGDVKAAIEAGKAQFWAGKASAVVTEINQYPRMDVLNVWLMGGNLDELLNRMLPQIETWARLQGCGRIEGSGYFRPGWDRALQGAGFRGGWTVYVKELAA